MDKTRPIIILKKKGGHGGHHGGAWKVAYADFVTAMMALFIVLWLLNSSKQVQEAVGGYFRIQPFFDSGSAKLNSDGSEMLITRAGNGQAPRNHLSIEGHTDSTPYAPTATYGNWELSSDRANAARRVMQANGIRADQIAQVRGFADQRLRKPVTPRSTPPIAASRSSCNTPRKTTMTRTPNPRPATTKTKAPSPPHPKKNPLQKSSSGNSPGESSFTTFDP